MQKFSVLTTLPKCTQSRIQQQFQVMFLKMLSCETAAAPKVFADYLLMLCPDVRKQLHGSLRHAKEKKHKALQFGSIKQQVWRMNRHQKEAFTTTQGVLSRLTGFINWKNERAVKNEPADSVSGVREVGSRQWEGTHHVLFFQMPFNSSSEMWQHPKLCLSHKSYLYKVTLFIVLSFMWSLEMPEILSTSCSLPGFSGRLYAVSWDSSWLCPFAWHIKTSLSQKKCEAQRSMWMRHEGKILGMLFVPWPGSFPAAAVFKSLCEVWVRLVPVSQPWHSCLGKRSRCFTCI